MVESQGEAGRRQRAGSQSHSPVLVLILVETCAQLGRESLKAHRETGTVKASLFCPSDKRKREGEHSLEQNHFPSIKKAMDGVMSKVLPLPSGLKTS